jgi:Mce-associated membrane protein
VEDQQPDRGDLTAKIATARTPVGKSRRARHAAEPTNAAEPVGPVETVGAAEERVLEATPDTGATPPETEILVPHRPAGPGWRIAAATSAVLFVGAATYAAAMVEPMLVDRALVHTKLDIARTAASAITTLWTYTPDNMDKLADRSSVFLSRGFASDYRKYVDAIAPTNKQAKVTNSTQVLGAAVESVSPSEATAIVYTNTVSTSPVTKNIPSLKYLSYRLTMERHGGRWLINGMDTITKLDLTPQL